MEPELFLRTGRKHEAALLVENYHYSKRAPNAVVVVTWHLDGGLFGGDGQAVAACFLSVPPTRWSEPVLELSRLVRHPDCVKPLTGLIAQACSHAKKHTDLVISFADNTHGHHGGVYQAASWNFAGKRPESMDGVVIGGVFHPGRSCNASWGTRSPGKLSKMLNVAVEPHYDRGKYLYWRPLSKAGKRKADRLRLDALPYPKPGGRA